MKLKIKNASARFVYLHLIAESDSKELSITFDVKPPYFNKYFEPT